MFDLCTSPEDEEGDEPMVSKLRAIIVSTAKETAFKKVRIFLVSTECFLYIMYFTETSIQYYYTLSNPVKCCVLQVVQATMVRDRQHGPIVELNRISVKRSRSRGGLAGPDGMKSVFGQMVAKMSLLTPDALFLPHRVWKVKFVGKLSDLLKCSR